VSVRRTPRYISTCFDWAVINSSDLRYPTHRVALAEALLLPWVSSQPTDPIKHELMSFLLKHYNDPRIRKNLWHTVSNDATDVMIRWLNGRTLQVFFEILRATADQIWQYRQKFWTAYFERGYIDEAWVAMGSEGVYQIKRMSDANTLNYANLLGADNTQSVC